MIEVVYAYSKTHTIIVVYYKNALYEVDRHFLYPTNIPQIYKVWPQHITMQTMLAQYAE